MRYFNGSDDYLNCVEKSIGFCLNKKQKNGLTKREIVVFIPRNKIVNPAFCCMPFLLLFSSFVSADERSFEELGKAISMNVNQEYSWLSAGAVLSTVQDQALMHEVTNDDRVASLHLILSKLKKEKASEKATSLFESKLKSYKAKLNRGQTISDHERYGLHAAMFLSFTFSNRKDFNRVFRDWNSWANNVVASDLYKKIKFKGGSEAFRKARVEEVVVPELLMILNLLVVEELGIETQLKETHKISKLLKDVGWTKLLFHSTGMRQFGRKVNVDRRILLLSDWGGLEALSTLERLSAIKKAQDVFDPPGIGRQIKRAVNSSIIDLADKSKEIMFELGAKDSAPKLVSGSRLALIGTDLPEDSTRSWKEYPPSKSNFLTTLKRFKKQLPDKQKEIYAQAFEEANQWVTKIPDGGLKVKERTIFKWPKLTDENKKDHKYLLKFEIVDSRAEPERPSAARK